MARQYRKFDQDFRQGAVRLVFETGTGFGIVHSMLIAVRGVRRAARSDGRSAAIIPMTVAPTTTVVIVVQGMVRAVIP